MSIIHQYQETQRQLEELQRKIEGLQDDPRLKAELEFKQKLEDLMTEFDKSPKQVLEILSPNHEMISTGKKPRKMRALKIYKNPHNGEVVETRGGNQKTLKNWKDKYGVEEVESWLVDGPGAQEAPKADKAKKATQEAPKADKAEKATQEAPKAK